MTSLADQLILDAYRRASGPITLAGGYPIAQCFKHLNLVEIPDVMDKKGFTTAAALMRRWFLGAAFGPMPIPWKGSNFDARLLPRSHVDTQIVKTQWVLRYPRAMARYLELKQVVQSRRSSDDSLKASKKALFDNLAAAGSFTAEQTNFGFGATTMDVHQTAHVNRRTVSANYYSKLMDPIDDLYCALGAFTLHVAAGGVVTPLDKPQPNEPTHQVRIEKLGFYVRDFYDFNEDQPLGEWSADEVAVVPSKNLVLVENASFQEWRKQHKHGGDFAIFSDVRWEHLSEPIVWNYPMSRSG